MSLAVHPNVSRRAEGLASETSHFSGSAEPEKGRQGHRPQHPFVGLLYGHLTAPGIFLRMLGVIRRRGVALLRLPVCRAVVPPLSAPDGGGAGVVSLYRGIPRQSAFGTPQINRFL